MNKRVLITGAGGFLGSHLTDRFLRGGYDVIGVDNFLTGRTANLAHLKGSPRFRLLECHAQHLAPVKERLDGVLHFASPASPPAYLEHPIATLHAGSLAVFRTLEEARTHGARYLLASTSEVYGDPQVHPQPESYWGHVNPIGPRSVYDEAKRFAEAATMAYHREHDVNTGIVRIFNTYGPRLRPDDGRVVTNFIVQALRGEPITVYGTGRQTRSFCYVDDLVEGIYKLYHSDEHEPVNVGNPAEFTVRQLAEMVIDFTGSRSEIVSLPLPEDDPKTRRPDITRARTLLGWEPQIQLAAGLRQTIPSLREQVESHGAQARVMGG